jgi:hypothetical protein
MLLNYPWKKRTRGWTEDTSSYRTVRQASLHIPSYLWGSESHQGPHIQVSCVAEDRGSCNLQWVYESSADSNSSWCSWQVFITKENPHDSSPGCSYGSGRSLFSTDLCVRAEDPRCFSTVLCLCHPSLCPCGLQATSSSNVQDASHPSQWWCSRWTSQDAAAIGRSWWKLCVSVWWIEIYQNSDSCYLNTSRRSPDSRSM